MYVVIGCMYVECVCGHRSTYIVIEIFIVAMWNLQTHNWNVFSIKQCSFPFQKIGYRVSTDQWFMISDEVNCGGGEPLTTRGVAPADSSGEESDTSGQSHLYLNYNSQ